MPTPIDPEGLFDGSRIGLSQAMRDDPTGHRGALGPAMGAFLGGHRPASTRIGVASLFTPQTLIEVEAVARPAAS